MVDASDPRIQVIDMHYRIRNIEKMVMIYQDTCISLLELSLISKGSTFKNWMVVYQGT